MKVSEIFQLGYGGGHRDRHDRYHRIFHDHGYYRRRRYYDDGLLRLRIRINL